MNEKPEKLFSVSRRGFLAGAAAIVTREGSEALAQSPRIREVRIAEELSSRSFRIQNPSFRIQERDVTFPADGILKWVRDELLNHPDFIRSLDSSLPASLQVVGTIMTFGIDLKFDNLIFAKMPFDQRSLRMDYYRTWPEGHIPVDSGGGAMQSIYVQAARQSGDLARLTIMFVQMPVQVQGVTRHITMALPFNVRIVR